jgi:hypothetical protein
MMEMMHFATLVFVTLFAATAAVALDWMLLRVMFVLMRPAVMRSAGSPGPRLASGAVQLTRAYAAQR